jgi:OmpA-OmpF porin, OOP family
MLRFKLTLALLLAICFTAVPGMSANPERYEKNDWIQHQNVAGSRDYPLISRFSGSIIQYYKTLEWDKYVLPVSPIVSDGGRKTWKRKLDLAGKITRIQYSVSNDNNSAFVYANYLSALKKAEWKILFAGNRDQELGNDYREWCFYYYGSDGLNQDRFGSAFRPGGNNHCYIAAEFQDEDRTVYAAIYITDYENSSKGLAFTLITQDTIEIQNPKTGLVTAKLMTDKIHARGHVALDGIFFETGKATLKENSRAALKNIAEFLKANSTKKFYVVGHTDNTGTFERNMALSLNRAIAVRKALTQQFQIPGDQLKAQGIGPLAPVLSNSTGEGRGRNRRVEIAEQ